MKLASLPLLDFITKVSDGYSRPEHLKPLCDLFDRIGRGEKVRALVSVQAYQYTSQTLIHGAVQALCRDPKQTVFYGGYGGGIGMSRSKSAQDCAYRAGLAAVNVAGGKEWRTPEGGAWVPMDVGTSVCGRGSDLLIVDEPHKNRQETESLIIRDKVHGWFADSALPRLFPKGSVIVAHRRGHQDDLIGRLSREQKFGPWENIVIPARPE